MMWPSYWPNGGPIIDYPTADIDVAVDLRTWGLGRVWPFSKAKGLAKFLEIVELSHQTQAELFFCHNSLATFSTFESDKVAKLSALRWPSY